MDFKTFSKKNGDKNEFVSISFLNLEIKFSARFKRSKYCYNL